MLKEEIVGEEKTRINRTPRVQMVTKKDKQVRNINLSFESMKLIKI